MKWFRVYSEIKDDPKMLEMDDHQRWLWICLMSIANDSEQRGTILNVRPRGLASSLRTTEDKLREALALYVDLDMIEYDEEARTITLLNFVKRQYDKPSDTPEQTRERQRVSRQRHANVTPSHAIYSDTDNTNTQKEEEAPAPGRHMPATGISLAHDFKSQMDLYKTIIGDVSGAQQSDEILMMLDLLAEHGILMWWDMALKVAADKNARNWAFVRAVLKNCMTQNTPPGVWPSGKNKNNNNGHARSDTRDGYNVPAGYEDVVNTDARTVAAPDPWRDLLAEADTLAPMVRETPQVKERTLRQLTRKLDGILAALPLPYDAALAALGERLA